MNEAAQKQFLNARQRFTLAKAVFYGMHGKVSAVSEATLPGTSSSRNGWFSIAVPGHALSVKSHQSSFHQFDGASWPTGKQIAHAWIECNAAYADYVQAYKGLGTEDKNYLGISGGLSDPEP